MKIDFLGLIGANEGHEETLCDEEAFKVKNDREESSDAREERARCVGGSQRFL